MKIEKHETGQSGWLKRIVSVLMVLAMMVTMFTGISFGKEEVSAASLEMEVDKKGNIVWDTSSNGNPNAGMHFRTIGWQFTFKRKTGDKWEVIHKAEVSLTNDRVSGENNTYWIKRGTTKVGKYKETENYGMHYEISGFKRWYDGNGKSYKIVADAVVKWYCLRSRNGKKIIDDAGYPTTKTEKASEEQAKKYGMYKSPYFTDYFDRNITFKNIKATATVDSTTRLKSQYIENSKTVEAEPKEESVSMWDDKDAVYIFGAESTEAGYVCTYITKTGDEDKYNGTLSVDSNGITSIEKHFELSEHTKVKFHSSPLSVKVTFKVRTNDGTKKSSYESYGSNTITYGTTEQLANGISKITSDSKLSKFYTKSDLTGTCYTKTQNIDKSKMLELYKLNGGYFNRSRDYSDSDYKVKTREITLYAEKNVPAKTETYNIVYDGNGSSNEMTPTSVTQNVGEVKNTTLKDNTFTKTGYHLDTPNVWRSKRNGTAYTNAQTVNSNTLDFDTDGGQTVTLLAQWEPNKCKIVYDGNGADSGTVPDQEVTYDDWSQKIPNGDGKYTKANHRFKGWARDPEAKTPEYTSGEAIDASLWNDFFVDANHNGSEIRLYAIWEKIETEKQQTKLTYKSGTVALNKECGTDTYNSGRNNTESTDTVLKDPADMDIYPADGESSSVKKYTKNESKAEETDTGIEVDGETVKSEIRYMFKAGDTVAHEMDYYYKFTGWSVDPSAKYGSSDKILHKAGVTVNGDLIAREYYSYVNPINVYHESGGYDDSGNLFKMVLPTTNKKADRAYVISLSASKIASYETYVKAMSAKLINSSSTYQQGIAMQGKLYKFHYNFDKTIGLVPYQYEASGQWYTTNDNSTVLTATWDCYPWFSNPKKPLHIFKGDVENGKIGESTIEDYLLNQVTVEDEEDGRKVNVELENFSLDELKKIQHTGGINVTFKATDSAGNVTKYTTMLVIESRTELEQTTADDLSGKLYYETGYPRFICRDSFEIGDPDSDNYYGQGYDGLTTNFAGQTVPVYLYVGGLHPQSKWYTNPELKAEIYKGFSNEENNTPEEVWEFSHQDVLDIQQFIEDHGIGNVYSEDSLDLFHDTFAPKCRTEYNPENFITNTRISTSTEEDDE